MQIQNAALSILALAASTNAFAPKAVQRNNVAVSAVTGGLDLPSIEAEVCSSFRSICNVSQVLFSNVLFFS